MKYSLALIAVVVAISSARAASSTVERLAAVIDYVAADYPGAIKNGQIVTESEYQEQLSLVDEATRLAAAVPVSDERARTALSTELQALSLHMRAKSESVQVATDCRRIHGMLIERFGLVLQPLGPPSRARAETLYASACAECHGKDGHADTEKARTLKPPPVSFFDEERMARISPALGFHALTFGINDTAMASFDSLPASDRWSLAFYVVGLRHFGKTEDLARGKSALEHAGKPVAETPSRLAALSDQELAALLGKLPPTDRAAAIDYLRGTAAFALDPSGTFSEARKLLGELAQHADDSERARELAIAAYLDGVEPHEAALRARDRDISDRIERAFADLRGAISSGQGPEGIRREVAKTVMLLDGAEEMKQMGSGSVPFFAALAIALREGFEISLLIGALLAFLRRSGRASLSRFVHYGWLSAIPAGLLTWYGIGAAIGGARRELTEAILTLLAATMLLFVSHFVLGRLESRKWLKFLERKTASASRFPLFIVAFVAAYREAIEIVLFFRALVLDSPEGKGAIVLGIAVGLVALALLVVVMQQLGRRLNPRPVMTASGILLTALAISLVGQGIRALQEGGFIGLTPIKMPSLPAIGIFPTIQGIFTQAVVLCLVLLPLWRERRKHPAKK